MRFKLTNFKNLLRNSVFRGAVGAASAATGEVFLQYQGVEGHDKTGLVDAVIATAVGTFALTATTRILRMLERSCESEGEKRERFKEKDSGGCLKVVAEPFYLYCETVLGSIIGCFILMRANILSVTWEIVAEDAATGAAFSAAAFLLMLQCFKSCMKQLSEYVDFYEAAPQQPRNQNGRDQLAMLPLSALAVTRSVSAPHPAQSMVRIHQGDRRSSKHQRAERLELYSVHLNLHQARRQLPPAVPEHVRCHVTIDVRDGQGSQPRAAVVPAKAPPADFCDYSPNQPYIADGAYAMALKR
jgi:hypothetical protein